MRGELYSLKMTKHVPAWAAEVIKDVWPGRTQLVDNQRYGTDWWLFRVGRWIIPVQPEEAWRQTHNIAGVPVEAWHVPPIPKQSESWTLIVMPYWVVCALTSSEPLAIDGRVLEEGDWVVRSKTKTGVYNDEAFARLVGGEEAR